MDKILDLVELSWKAYKYKVANKLLSPETEKMMQLQFALLLQTLAPLYEYSEQESIKVIPEWAIELRRGVERGSKSTRSIDIVILYKNHTKVSHYPIELKCFRRSTRVKSGKRGAQNLGMYDYWDDIEKVEQYLEFKDFAAGFQLTLTDDRYYVETEHKGSQVSVFSTFKGRGIVSGVLEHHIANRPGRITLKNVYDTSKRERLYGFYFIRQDVFKRAA